MIQNNILLTFVTIFLCAIVLEGCGSNKFDIERRNALVGTYYCEKIRTTGNYPMILRARISIEDKGEHFAYSYRSDTFDEATARTLSQYEDGILNIYKDDNNNNIYFDCIPNSGDKQALIHFIYHPNNPSEIIWTWIRGNDLQFNQIKGITKEFLVKDRINELFKTISLGYNGDSIAVIKELPKYFEKNGIFVTCLGVCESIDSLKNHILFQSKYINNHESKFELQRLNFFNDSTCFASGVEDENYVYENQSMENKFQTLILLQRNGKHWLVQHIHQSGNLSSFENIKSLAGTKERTPLSK